MNEEQLIELGFKLKKEYVSGDNDDIVTQIFIKGCLRIDLDYNKKNGKLTAYCIDINANSVDDFPKITFSEIKQLDKILNK